MKIVVGIDSVTNEQGLAPLIAAGADEFYIGFIPEEWSDKYGYEVCPNRRPFPGCNYRSEDDLEKISSAVHRLGKKIYFAVNEHEYDKDRMVMAIKMLRLAEILGFDAAIVSNLALMIEARADGISIPFTVSIGGGASSVEAVDFYMKNVPGIKRIILPRALAVHEIKEIAQGVRGKGISLEAFAIGDPCIFNDEYCFSWHSGCDQLFCAFLINGQRFARAASYGEDWKEKNAEEMLLVREAADAAAETESGSFNSSVEAADFLVGSEREDFLANTVRLCGLCSLRLFEEWGIEAVKVPARGGIRKDELIHLVKKVVDGKIGIDGCKALIGNPAFCSGLRCYYNYPSEKNAL